MDATSLLINKHEICCCMQILKHNIKVSHKLIFWNKFNPLYQNMNIPSLEKNVFPLGLLDHIEDEANVVLLLLANFVVFLDLAQHANDGEESVFLELRCEPQSRWAAGEVGLKQLILNEGEGR